MACKVSWTDAAERDVDSITRYIVQGLSAPAAASKLLDELEKAVERIASFPELYEVSPLTPLAKRELRACFVKRYVILYSCHPENGVTTARVFSTLQDYASIIARS